MPAPLTFLESLAPAERDALLAAGHGRSWSAGEPILREGEPASSAVILLSGVVKIHKRGRDGAEALLRLAGPGDLLGEIAAVAGAQRAADATALELVEGVAIGGPDLRAFLGDHPSVTLALLDLATARLRAADIRRLEFANAESLARVASRLVELGERFGAPDASGHVDVEMPINQDELASWAAASKESTARALRTLRELGLIETHRRRIVVFDLERLSDHATRL